jgi:hypothetical protein
MNVRVFSYAEQKWLDADVPDRLDDRVEILKKKGFAFALEAKGELTDLLVVDWMTDVVLYREPLNAKAIDSLVSEVLERADFGLLEQAKRDGVKRPEAGGATEESEKPSTGTQGDPGFGPDFFRPQ